MHSCTTTHNHPQPPTTNHNQQPTTTSQNEPQTTKTNHTQGSDRLTLFVEFVGLVVVDTPVHGEHDGSARRRSQRRLRQWRFRVSNEDPQPEQWCKSLTPHARVTRLLLTLRCLPPHFTSLSNRSHLILFYLFLSSLFLSFLAFAYLILSHLILFNIILPCLALPCLALPCLALPCLALPCLALPCLALPCLALPCLALPCLALPCLALPCLALPCLALPCLALPHTVTVTHIHLHIHLRIRTHANSFAHFPVTCAVPQHSDDQHLIVQSGSGTRRNTTTSCERSWRISFVTRMSGLRAHGGTSRRRPA